MESKNRNLNLVHVSCPTCSASRSSRVASGVDFEYRTSPDTFDMVVCDRCGVIRLDPRPAVSELAIIYPKNYIPYNFDKELGLVSSIARKFFLRGRVKVTTSLVKTQARILDAGCGNGDLLLLLREMGSPEWELTGMDIDDRVAARLKANGVHFIKGRFEELTAKEGLWDCIWMKDVIEHLEHPSVLMANALKLLKPGGVLIMETPNFDGWDAKLFRKRYWGGWHFPRHWTIYDSQNIKATLLDLGFEKASVKPTLSPNFWAQSLHHWLSETQAGSIFANWFGPRNFLLMIFFSLVDWVQIFLTRKSSNMRVVAHKSLD